MNITNDIKYIGVDDTDLDLFESQYIIPNGISYNSYLITDEKVAVMDTVDARKSEEWLQNLDAALGGRQPDYLVVQHMEPDHSASIFEFSKEYGICKTDYKNTEHYKITKSFLNNPEKMLEYLLK